MLTTQQYFNSIRTDRLDAMLALQKLIIEVFPNVVEDMVHKLPTYSFNNLKICAIASQKNYMSLYIMNYDLLENFKEELSAFNCGKSCLRFKKLDEKTLLLFKKILVYIKKNISNSEFYKS